LIRQIKSRDVKICVYGEDMPGTEEDVWPLTRVRHLAVFVPSVQ